MKIKTDEELWEILGSIKKFNAFLANHDELLLQRVLLAVPALVIHHIKNEISYAKIKDKFFIANPELKAYEYLVAQKLNLVASEHSDWDINKVFNQAGIEAKKEIRKLGEVNNGKNI